MAPKEPTRAQLSSKLAYHAQKPAFLQKLQNRMAGVVDDDEEEDEEFEHVGNGREPIPRRPRPAIPERPADDPGSADEDFDDEKPQVVVLKEGKHLTAWEAENVRRKEKGLSPLPDPEVEALKRAAEADAAKSSNAKTEGAAMSKTSKQGLSFSSSSKSTAKPAKRKAVGQIDEGDEEPSGSKPAPKKKAKKQNKKLLSFGDDA